MNPRIDFKPVNSSSHFQWWAISVFKVNKIMPGSELTVLGLKVNCYVLRAGLLVQTQSRKTF